MNEKDKVIDSSEEVKDDKKAKLFASMSLSGLFEGLDLCLDVGELIGDIVDIFTN